MSNLAVLYKVKQGASPQSIDNLSIDLHTNYWKLPKEKGHYNRFVDIGVKVYNAQTIQSVLLYLPIDADSLQNRLMDLGDVISRDNFVSVLFNDDFEVHKNTTVPAYNYAIPNTLPGDQAFWIYSLSKSNFEITAYPHGALLEIKILSFPQNLSRIPVNSEMQNEGTDSIYNLYFRFRLQNINIGEFSIEEPIANDAFQSFFSATEMINLHINSIKDLNMEDYQLLKSSYSFFKINKFHFFFVGSPRDEAVSGGFQYKDCSLFEIEKWKNYIYPISSQQTSCIAYHWKVVDCLKGCHVFCRTVFKSTNWSKIIKYILIVTLMGIAASYVANMIPAREIKIPCIEQLKNDSIQSMTSAHTMPYYKSLGHQEGECPVAEDYYKRCLALPMYPSLTDEEQQYVIDTICKFYSSIK